MRKSSEGTGMGGAGVAVVVARTVVVVVAVVAGACGVDRGEDATAGDGQIVATIPPLADIAGQLAGGAASVTSLLPPGSSPDLYDPTPRTAQRLERAAVVVRAGGAIDDWLGTEPVRDQAVLVLADVASVAGDRAADNPHRWLDPLFVRDDLLPPLADALAAAFPDSAAAIRRRADAYADSLTALHEWIGDTLASVPSRRFVAAHAAWPHFAARYDLEPVGVVHRSPGRDVPARELAEIVEAVRRSGAAGVIAEPQLGRSGVQALADELGLPIELADPLGGPGIEGRETYLELMRFNARAFARVLGGDPGGDA